MGKRGLVPYSFAFTGDGDIFEMAAGHNISRVATNRDTAPLVAVNSKVLGSLTVVKEASSNRIGDELSEIKVTLERQKHLEEEFQRILAGRDNPNEEHEFREKSQSLRKQTEERIRFLQLRAEAIRKTNIISFDEFEKSFSSGGVNSSRDVKLEILGHGNRGSGVLASRTKDGVQSSFTDIAKNLAKSPLFSKSPLLNKLKEFRLHSCFSGEGEGRQRAPAVQFHQALVDAKFENPVVQGYFGAGRTYGGTAVESGLTRFLTEHRYREIGPAGNVQVLRSKDWRFRVAG